MTTDKLREQAENRVSASTADVSSMSQSEMKRMIYELEVHHEELEIQNEELRRIHQELRASNDRYSDLYDFAPVGYLTVDADGAIVESNLTAARMLRRDRSKIVGARLGLYCEQSCRVALKEHLEQVLSSSASLSCELTFTMPSVATLEVRLDSSRVASGNGWHCRLIMTDISRRKRTEKSLAEKSKHLKSIADTLPVLIAYINTEGQFQFSNAAFQEWFAFPVDRMSGCHIGDLVAPECAQELEDYLTDALNGRRVEFETMMTHQTQGPRYLNLMLVPDRDSDGTVNGVHGLGIDITERKHIEDQNSRSRSFSAKLARLNASEMDVYELLICGLSNKAIAFKLDIGLRTAERRRQVIFEKLGVDSLASLLQKLAAVRQINPPS